MSKKNINSKEREKSTKTDNVYIIFAFIGFIMPIVFFEKKHINKLYKLFTDKRWIVGCLFIISWSIYIFIHDRKKTDEQSLRRNRATRHAITAFIIALFAYSDLTILPFWTIWLVTYFLENTN